MPAFSGVADTTLDEFARSATRRSVPRGQALFSAGDTPEAMVLITRGFVKVVRGGQEVSDPILGLFGPRDAVGIVAVLQQRPYPASAIAISPMVDLIAIPAHLVLERMKRDAALASSISQSLSQGASVLRTKVDIIAAGRVAPRLAFLLRGLADRFGDDHEDGTTVVPIALSRAELASLVGARVETTIRVLSDWHKKGLVETTKEGFVLRGLDPHTLDRLGDE